MFDRIKRMWTRQPDENKPKKMSKAEFNAKEDVIRETNLNIVRRGEEINDKVSANTEEAEQIVLQIRLIKKGEKQGDVCALEERLEFLAEKTRKLHAEMLTLQVASIENLRQQKLLYRSDYG